MPKSLLEWLFSIWNPSLAYVILLPLLLCSIPLIKVNRSSKNAPRWLLLLPVLWLIWQVLSMMNTIDLHLTKATLAHFTSAVIMFYLGYFALSQMRRMEGFRLPLLAGFLLIIWWGLDQHFGGLAATRDWIYAQPNWQSLPPDYLEKIGKDRIFSTIFYPNAFAGALILLTPLCAILTWQMTRLLQIPSRIVIIITIISASLACLFWTGSKSGWLICIIIFSLYALQIPFSRWMKCMILTMIILFGLLGFFLKYADYFDKGASSLAARFDYWNAAWNIAKSNPIFGSGAGTFQKSYSKIKKPDSEMARLAHNDYLQQASDSGFLGALFYATFIMSSLFFTFKKTSPPPLQQALWLGLLGFAIQGFVEFGLYIPSLAWTFFLLLGWLLGQEKSSQKT